MCQLSPSLPPSLSDLFDNEGFSLSDLNESLVGSEQLESSEKVYFIDDEMEAARNHERATRNGDVTTTPSLEEAIDLQQTWVRSHTLTATHIHTLTPTCKLAHLPTHALL